MSFHQETVRGSLRATASKVYISGLSQTQGNSFVVFAFLPRFMINAFDAWLTEVISLCVCFCSQFTENLL